MRKGLTASEASMAALIAVMRTPRVSLYDVITYTTVETVSLYAIVVRRTLAMDQGRILKKQTAVSFL